MARRLYLAFMVGLLAALGVAAQDRQELLESKRPLNAPKDGPPAADPSRLQEAGARPADPIAKPAPAGSYCLVCDGPASATDVEIVYRGRRVVLHTGLCCFDDFKKDPEVYFAAMEPRSALFQEPPVIPSPMRDGWFVFGLYVLCGLLVGALCGYLAVGRGLSPLGWFFFGVVANVVALAVLLTRKRADLSLLPAGIPPGLAKVPTTRAPVACGVCGAANHPSARSCVRCGAALAPQVTAETTRV